MPNTFAYIMLILWPFISLYFYKRFNTVTATFLTIVGGYLILPVKTAIDFPLIPPFDKQSIPVLCSLIGIYFVKKNPINLLPKDKLMKMLVVVIVTTPLISIFTNQFPTYNNNGLNYKLGLTVILMQYIQILPLIIASQIIRTEKDFLAICKLFVMSGLIYSIPILFEVRISPQLHSWIYGFFPHSFAQQIRFDGFRPVVFLGHGLLVAIYMMVIFGLSTLLWKKNIRVHKSLSPKLVMLFLLFILILTKSVGAILMGGMVLFSVVFLSIKQMKFIIYGISFIVIAYPLLCILNLFPHQQLVDLAASFDLNRAQSLNFRFYNETLLLEHAKEQLFFGWGGEGRNLLPGSIVDGRWIIELGQRGVVGFLSLFGLAVFSVLKSTNTQTHNNFKVTLMIGSMIVGLTMVDNILNSSLATWIWFLIGSLGFVCHENAVLKSGNKNV